jgi:hypothetical protein
MLPVNIKYFNGFMLVVMDMDENITSSENPIIPNIGLSIPKMLAYLLVWTVSHPFDPVIAEHMLS